jgi:hypothetical protein
MDLFTNSLKISAPIKHFFDQIIAKIEGTSDAIVRTIWKSSLGLSSIKMFILTISSLQSVTTHFTYNSHLYEREGRRKMNIEKHKKETIIARGYQ